MIQPPSPHRNELIVNTAVLKSLRSLSYVPISQNQKQTLGAIQLAVMYVTIVSTISLCTYTEHVVTGLPYMIGLFRGFILLKMVNITLVLFKPLQWYIRVRAHRVK
jgi:hypothetical protein